MGTTLSKQGKQKSAHEIPTFKIVLVGEPGVGKSSVFLRYTKNQFDYSYQPSVSVTIGNVVRKINIPYQGVVSVVIWDVPGREEMDLRKNYYKDVDAAIVVVDVSDIDTIGLAPTWKQDILNHAQMTMKTNLNKIDKVEQTTMTSTLPNIPVLLLGNKADKLESKNDDTRNADAETDAEKAVKELEDTASKHSFIGSVTVSAKDGDGSVHAAIQVLVRHLLQKQMADRKKTRKPLANIFGSNEISSQDETDNQKTFFPFLKVNIGEFDDVFKCCEEPMKSIEDCGKEYLKSLRMFKRSCCVSDLTPAYKSSLEDCITAIKENMIVDKENTSCGIKAIDDAGFVKLVIDDDILDDMPGPIHKIIRIFHTKVAVAATDVLKMCSVAYGNLKDSDSQLEGFCDTFEELSKQAGLSSEKVRTRAWVDIQANRTRLAEALGTAMDHLQNVENDCKKIKAAVLW